MLKLDSLQREQIQNYKTLYLNECKVDSLRKEQLGICKDRITQDSYKIESLENSINTYKHKNKRKNWIISVLSVISSGLILSVIFK